MTHGQLVYSSKLPLVSIIVITYNSARYVIETLISINNQTYQNIELIISDDASCDDTVDLCRNWILKNKDRFVRTELITSDKNLGISANCNRGIKSANGEWIKIIAGDDAFVEWAIDDVINYVEQKRNVDILLTQVEMFIRTFSPENSIGIFPSAKDQVNVYSETATSTDQLEYLLNGGFHHTPGLFSRNIIKDLGLYDESYTLIEDIPFFFNLALKGKVIHFVPIVTVKYRKHNNNLTNSERRILPAYYLQTYTVAFKASKVHGKFKFIWNNYWHKILITFIFYIGNKGIAGLIINKIRVSLQPIRFYNFIARFKTFFCFDHQKAT